MHSAINAINLLTHRRQHLAVLAIPLGMNLEQLRLFIPRIGELQAKDYFSFKI